MIVTNFTNINKCTRLTAFLETLNQLISVLDILFGQFNC